MRFDFDDDDRLFPDDWFHPAKKKKGKFFKKFLKTCKVLTPMIGLIPITIYAVGQYKLMTADVRKPQSSKKRKFKKFLNCTKRISGLK